MSKKIVIAGGGAAGFFAAVNIAERQPGWNIIILEKTNKVLSKVKVSGGGRCNVTNIISEPAALAAYYPRGRRELVGAFHRFTSANTITWFERRNIKLKAEQDGRIFPVTDDSMTIVNCLLSFAEKAGVRIITGTDLIKLIPPSSNSNWLIKTPRAEFNADAVLMATGGNNNIWQLLKKLGHKIEQPVPSLFTFNINDKRIKNLAGVSLKNVEVKVQNSSLTTKGDILITHWGLSGPAILKLSAWGARELHDKNYCFHILINWINKKHEEAKTFLTSYKNKNPGKNIYANPLFNVPSRLWERLSEAAGIEANVNWNGISKSALNALANELTSSNFPVTGKSTFKEEFVTCGGVNLKEVNFKTMESKLHKGLYFAGEVLDIDAITGGFNFQSAWTTAWIASEAIAINLD